MNSQNNYEQRYNDLVGKLGEMHERNVKRMSSALKSLLIVPTIFLVLLFLTNSSKTFFLVLWIVSMFVIACILIIIEYQDYTLRKMLMSSGGTLYAAQEAAPDTESVDAENTGETAPAASVSGSKERVEELLKALGGVPVESDGQAAAENAEKQSEAATF